MSSLELHWTVVRVAVFPQYSIADAPYSLPSNVTSKDLSILINTLLENDKSNTRSFDFVINGEILRFPLDEHISQKELSLEDVIEIEYIESHPAPRPELSLQHDDWVSCLHSTSQYILSGCYDNSLKLWTLDGMPVMTIPTHSAPVKCVSWIPGDDEDSNIFVSGGHDQILYIWRWNHKSKEVDCLHSCRGHAASVDCVAVDPSNTRFCSGSWDHMLKLWSADVEVGPGEEDDTEPTHKRKRTDRNRVNSRVPILTLSGHKEGVSAVNWLSDSEVCTASWDHTLRLWDLQRAKEKSCLQGSKVFLDTSYSAKNGLILAASADRHIRSYDPRVQDGALVKSVFTSHIGWVSSVRWSPVYDQQFVSGSYDCVMKLWDYRSPKAALYDMKGHSEKILAVDWSVPHLLLSGGADNHLKIFHYKEIATNL